MPMIYNNTKSRKRQGYFLNKFVMFCMLMYNHAAQTKTAAEVEDVLHASRGGYVI